MSGLSDSAESIPNPPLSFFLKLIGASQSFLNTRGVYSPGYGTSKGLRGL